MKARPASSFCGLSSAALAFSKVARSGPCADMQLWIEMPPGRKPSALASYTPCTRPMSSLITLRWNDVERRMRELARPESAHELRHHLALAGVLERRRRRLEIASLCQALRADRSE